MPRRLLALLAVAGFASTAGAEPPRSYRKLSPGGRFVFVMVSSEPARDEIARTPEAGRKSIWDIRRRYARTGLYRNDDAERPWPIWTVEWWSQGVEVSSDGLHAIRRGPLPLAPNPGEKPDLSGEALSFFAEGRFLCDYTIADLVYRPEKLRRVGDSLSWLAESNLDDGGSEYTITTQDGGKFAFDIRTGAMVRSDPARRTPRWAWPAGVGAAGALAGLVVWRRGKIPRPFRRTRLH